jgi:hypothetical protein
VLYGSVKSVYRKFMISVVDNGANFLGYVLIQSAPETRDGFSNLKTSLPATRRFYTDSHRAQCCSEFS